MRPDTIVIHCSATRENKDFTIQDVDRSHKARGFRRPIQNEALKHIGYQYYVRRNGVVECGRHEDETGAHCLGYNDHSIGICYEGGSDADGNPKDTRTRHQCEAMNALVTTLQQVFPKIIILGHNQLKVYGGNACPCFDVQKEWMSKK